MPSLEVVTLSDYRQFSMQLILASQSPYRKAQLEAFGVAFACQVPRLAEEELKKSGPKDAVELCRLLALKKAESLKPAFDNVVIVGADQIAELNGERLDKPGDAETAFRQLKKMQGQTHRLITSIAVVSPLKTIERVDIASLVMRPLSDEEIRAYIKLDEPYDCAGSYKIERAGLALMERVDAHDPSAIQGLPLVSLAHALMDLGLNLPELWSRK